MSSLSIPASSWWLSATSTRRAYYRLNDAIEVPLRMLSWAAQSSVLWFLGSHAVDTLRWFTGSEVVRV